MSEYSDDPFWKAEQYDTGFPRFKQQIDTLSDELSLARSRLAALEAQVAAMCEAVRDVEWCVLVNEVGTCPSCWNHQRQGHARNCRLAAALATGVE